MSVPLIIAVVSGCNPSGQTARSTAVETAPTVAAADLKPLPGAAAAHPAPGPAAVNLDRSESAAASQPNDVGAQRDAAYCYYKLEAYAQAVPALKKVVGMAPTSTPDKFYLAYAQMAVGNLEDAGKTLLEITEQKGLSAKDLGEAYFQIGNCDWALGHDEQAVESFSRCLNASPHEGHAELALGVYYAGKSKRDVARQQFTVAAQDLPVGRDRAQAYACLGRLAEESKDGKTALAEYRQALAMDSTNGQAKRGLARMGKI